MTPKKAYWAIPLRENQAIGQNDMNATRADVKD
jgi:hypothetical protein